MRNEPRTIDARGAALLLIRAMQSRRPPTTLARHLLAFELEERSQLRTLYEDAESRLHVARELLSLAFHHDLDIYLTLKAVELLACYEPPEPEGAPRLCGAPLKGSELSSHCTNRARFVTPEGDHRCGVHFRPSAGAIAGEGLSNPS